jgi:hypothetical protein
MKMPALVGPDGTTSLREYAGYHGGAGGLAGSFAPGTHPQKVPMLRCCPILPGKRPRR